MFQWDIMTSKHQTKQETSQGQGVALTQNKTNGVPLVEY